jgi:hypothetical protein
MGGSETRHIWWFGPRTLDPDSSSKSDRHSLIKFKYSTVQYSSILIGSPQFDQVQVHWEAALESLEAVPSSPVDFTTPPFVCVLPSEIARDHCHMSATFQRWRPQAVVYYYL